MSGLSKTLIVLGFALANPVGAQGCLSNSDRSAKSDHSSLSHSDDDRRSVSVRWRRGNCEIRVDARGDFGVKPDLSGFVGVEDGGWVEVQERDGDVVRRVRVVANGRDLEYRWTLDGRNGFDVNRERWLADILLAMERRTAMFAKWRVPELVRTGGPDAVLDETDRMASDYARRTYFSGLLGIRRLDDATIERMLRQTELMSSDYERAEILRAVSAKQGPVSDRAARAMIAVAGRMSSDYEKRRALSAGLESVATL